MLNNNVTKIRWMFLHNGANNYLALKIDKIALLTM